MPHRRTVRGAMAGLLLGSLIIAIAVGGFIARLTDGARTSPAHVQSPRVQNPQLQSTGGPISTTLQEALTIAASVAQQWRPDAAALNAASTDIGDPSPTGAGADGRRVSWSLDFGSPSDPDVILMVDVISGTVSSTVEDGASGDQGPYLPPVISLDSPQAIQIARAARTQLAPAYVNSKARGYHFVIQPNGSGAPVITVMGEFDGMPAKLDIDATTGTVISSEVYTYSGSGSILFSSDAGQTWRCSNVIGTMITAIKVHPWLRNIVYAASIEYNVNSFMVSYDFGATWSTVSQIPPQEFYPWIYDIVVLPGSPDQIVVGGTYDLWVSTDGGSSWSTPTNLPQGLHGDMELLGARGNQRLVVSFNSGVYATADLVTWTKLHEPSLLSQSSTGEEIAAMQESTAVVIDSTRQVTFSIPSDARRLAGIFDPPTPNLTIAAAPGSVYEVYSVAGGVQWSTTLQDRLGVIIAVAPGFPNSSPVILAGGKAIYRKITGTGQWATVLSDPSDPSLVQAPPGVDRDMLGIQRIIDLALADGVHAIAVNSGAAGWESWQ